MTYTKLYVSTMSSISKLQGTCNMHEQQLTAKLTSLAKVKDTNGKKVTEAIFMEFTGDESELGKAKLTEAAAGPHSAWILTQPKSIEISRQ